MPGAFCLAEEYPSTSGILGYLNQIQNSRSNNTHAKLADAVQRITRLNLVNHIFMQLEKLNGN